METGTVVLISLAALGHTVTIATLIWSRGQLEGRLQEKLRGLGRALDTFKADNADDHRRYDAHMVDAAAHERGRK